MPFPQTALAPFVNCPTCLGGGGTSTVTALNDLTDVTLTAPLTDGMVLTYNGTTLIWEASTPMTAGIYELGGAGGLLVVGDGVDIPNPVGDGYVLLADELYPILTTPATGGTTVAELRLEPAGTVVSTITFAAGSQVGTFTPYADTPLADGQWFETVVTQVNGTGATEFTLAGSLGAAGSTLPALGLNEVGEGSVLPADDSSGELFRLENHATLPDGLYRWSQTGLVWIQV